MSEDKSLEENSAGSISLNPGMTIGGIGDPVIPTYRPGPQGQPG